MNARKTLILALLAAVLVAIALGYSASRRPSQEAALQSPALPGLAERLASVDKVTVTGPGDSVIATLVQTADGWQLTERAHPADAGQLRTLLLGIAEAKRVEAKTAKPDLYDRLGVEDVSGEQAQGAQLTIEGGGEPLALIIGQNVARGTGTYVRVPGEAQSWQVDRNLAVEKTTSNWLDKALLDIQPDRIEKLSIRHGDDLVQIRASEEASGDFVISNLPKGREAQSEFVADASVGFVQGLRLEDVASVEDRPAPEDARNALFSTVDGIDLSVRSWTVDGKPWAQLSASLDTARASAAIEAEQAREAAEWQAKQAALDAESTASAETGDPLAPEDKAPQSAAEIAPEAPLAVRDPDAHRAERLAALGEEVARLQARLEGRSFLLPSFKAGNLNRELEAYLKPRD